MKLRIWTEACHPFNFGDVHAPVSTKVEVGPPIDLDHGIQVYLIAAPNGQTYVAESVTGAFVGICIEDVREHVAESDPKVMKQQIEDAKERVKKARPLDPEDFWSMFR